MHRPVLNPATADSSNQGVHCAVGRDRKNLRTKIPKMFAELLNAATVLIAVACLWIRRDTWHYHWEQPKTIGLALITAGASLKLTTPYLHDHDLHVIAAHLLVLSGIAGFAYSANHKLVSDAPRRPWNITRIALPIALCSVALGTLYTFGARPQPNMQFPDNLTIAYWVTYDAFIIYFLLLCAYALFWLWKDPPSRTGAAMYLVAVALYLVSATCRVLQATVEDNVPSPVLVDVASATSGLGIIVFAVASACMWKQQKHLYVNTHHRSVTKAT